MGSSELGETVLAVLQCNAADYLVSPPLFRCWLSPRLSDVDLEHGGDSEPRIHGIAPLGDRPVVDPPDCVELLPRDGEVGLQYLI